MLERMPRKGTPRAVNVHEAKTHLSRLLNRVERGEEIIIARAGKPIARLLPFEPSPAPRTLGGARGQVWIADDFDAPLPPELLDAFEGDDGRRRTR
jgi:prevent-host-death family protein